MRLLGCLRWDRGFVYKLVRGSSRFRLVVHLATTRRLVGGRIPPLWLPCSECDMNHAHWLRGNPLFEVLWIGSWLLTLWVELTIDRGTWRTGRWRGVPSARGHGRLPRR